MRRLAFAVCLALTFFAAAGLAADISGKWTASIQGMDGNQMTLNYTFKQDGAKLTGSVEVMGNNVEIKDGKVDGDKISFYTLFGPDGNMKINNTGTISGDEIKLTSKFEGGDFGGGDMPPFTLKRAK